MARPRLLVTGFGPFPGMPRNPSGGVARAIAALPRWRIAGIACRCLVLPTTYAALDDIFAAALEAEFDAILMIGVAGRSRRVRVESRALNRISILFPDAAGAQPSDLARKHRPPSRKTAARPQAALAILRRSAIRARLSQDAGRYLCNAGYYRALAQTCPVLFIHIPKPPKTRPSEQRQRRRMGWSEGLAFAFAAIAQRMLTPQARLQASRTRTP